MHRRCVTLAIIGAACGGAFSAYAQDPVTLIDTGSAVNFDGYVFWFELAKTLGLPGVFGFLFYRVGKWTESGIPIQLDKDTIERLDKFDEKLGALTKEIKTAQTILGEIRRNTKADGD